MPSAAILAGGQSRRMAGRTKSELRFGSARLIDRQLDVLRRVASHILIVASDGAPFDGLGVTVVSDALPGTGPLGGLYTALTSAPTSQVLVVACDLPFLDARFLTHLAQLGRDVDAAVPSTSDGYQPLCASYSRACAGPILRRIRAGELKVTGFYDEIRMRDIPPRDVAEFDSEGMMFFNVNTADDYRLACSWCDRSGPES